MTSNDKSIYIWSPYTGKVGTVQNVINNLYCINKYSNFTAYLINTFGEWDNYIDDLMLQKVKIYNFKLLRFIKGWDIKGFFKSRFVYLLIFIFSYFPLLNLIKKKKPSFLIVHLISSLPLLIFILFNFKTKLILHIAGHPKLNFFRKFYWKFSSKKIFKIICPSEELKKIFIDNDIFTEEQLEVIEDPHLIMNKIRKFKKDDLEDDFFNDSKVLIAIGRMTKQKNYSFLIKNFKKISKKYNDTKLLIIGDGEEKNNLELIIENLNLQNLVKLINYEINIYKYLKKSNFYVSTSTWEGSSLAMVDAAFIGIPVLCSDCPSGRKEFIGKNERGFLYKQNDTKDFLNTFDYMYTLNNLKIQKLLIKAKKQTKKFTAFKSFLKLKKILN